MNYVILDDINRVIGVIRASGDNIKEKTALAVKEEWSYKRTSVGKVVENDDYTIEIFVEGIDQDGEEEIQGVTLVPVTIY